MEMTFGPAGRNPTQGAGGTAAHASAPPRLEPGVTLNERYQIDEFVGHGVYGEVYRGRDLSDGRLVTIKALLPQLLADARVRQRLEGEIQIAVQLDHKNVGTTHGLFGAMVGADAVAYLVAEYIDGQTLREMIEKKRAAGRTFSLKGTYNVVAHLCNALVYAHGATVHGGLSPDSVLVNTAGRVKVVDFGLARTLRPLDHLQAQAALGPEMMAAIAPEMASAPDRADARADVYSVGVILFELLSGRPPSESFERPSSVAPGVPPALDQLVERCLAPQPNDRFPDAEQLKEALHEALQGLMDSSQERRIPPRDLTGAQPAVPKSGVPPLSVSPRSSGGLPPLDQPRAPPPVPKAGPAALPRIPSAPIQVGQRSLNVDSALSAMDDGTERWLIQKDKLDFGPFSMRDVRSQIEAGKILGEHTIIDTETTERRKVKDHPQLRQAVMEREARLAEKVRLETEDADRRKQRGKVVTLLLMIVFVVLGVGGGVTWYVLNMKPKVIKEIVHEKEDLDWLKGLEISMKVDPPPPKHKSSHGKRKGGSGQFSDTTTLGDASEGGGDETLDQAVVQKVMTQNFRVLVGCIGEERRRNRGLRSIEMDFIIKGSGSVSGVKVNGQQGTPLANCMFGKMQTVAFPKFDGAKTHASFSLNLK